MEVQKHAPEHCTPTQHAGLCARIAHARGPRTSVCGVGGAVTCPSPCRAGPFAGQPVAASTASQTWERVHVAPRRATRAHRGAYHPCHRPWAPCTSAGAANSHRGATVDTPQKRFPHRLPAEAGRTREGVRRRAEVPGTHLVVALGASTAHTCLLPCPPA